MKLRMTTPLTVGSSRDAAQDGVGSFLVGLGLGPCIRNCPEMPRHPPGFGIGTYRCLPRRPPTPNELGPVTANQAPPATSKLVVKNCSLLATFFLLKPSIKVQVQPQSSRLPTLHRQQQARLGAHTINCHYASLHSHRDQRWVSASCSIAGTNSRAAPTPARDILFCDDATDRPI